jgi:hypothetical protein
MKNILKNTCIEFFKREEFRRDLREMMGPVFDMIYNELYLYIWIIAVYNVFLFCGVLGLFIVILRFQSNMQSNFGIKE